ncbi:MAG: hypothetical protein JKY65_09625, partial [Planctomycetes bacterium]|nr:hypothetical protein [Planctomycetota bacterium]
MSESTPPVDDNASDFSRFRARRLANRTPPRTAPTSGIPFFGTDRMIRAKIRVSEIESRESSVGIELPHDALVRPPVEGARSLRPAPKTPAPARQRTARRAGPPAESRSP